MSKEQQSLIDKAYENYKSTILEKEIKKSAFELTVQSMSGKTFILPQEEFINKCKTDQEFSEKWGLKIEERELSRQERSDYYYKYGNSEGIVEGSLDLPIWVNDETAYKWYDKRNVPNKLITITYNDKTIESYEQRTIS